MRTELDQTSTSRVWNEMAATDPFWAVLSDRGRKRGRWSREEFLETGAAQVGEILEIGRTFGVPHGDAAAIDFGCGAGRLTQPLAERFHTAIGLDISTGMLEIARKLADQRQRIEFRQHSEVGLSGWTTDSVDCVVSDRVLQHVRRPEDALALIAEFVRVLRPGGLLYFQVPASVGILYRLFNRARPFGYLRRLGLSTSFLYRFLGLHGMTMIGIRESLVREVIDRSGAQVMLVRRPTRRNRQYFVGKRAPGTSLFED